MRRGATFVEIAIAVLLIAVVLGPMIVAFTGTVRGTDHTNRRVVAIALTNQALERFKSEPLARLKELFASDAGARALTEDPTLQSEMVGAAFQESVTSFHLSGKFEEKQPGKVGVLTITCKFPSQQAGKEAEVTLAKVVADFTKVSFEGEQPPPLP